MFAIKRLLHLLIFICLSGLAVQAQNTYDTYNWLEGDFTLLYPTGWEAPVAVSSPETGTETLELAQVFAGDAASRPPAIPFITIKRLATPEDFVDIATTLRAELDAVAITLNDEENAQLLNEATVQVDGFSADNTLYGMARGLLLPDSGELLLVIGRQANPQRDAFRTVFGHVANSLTQGTDSPVTQPGYGVLWYVENLPDAGEEAILDVGAIALDSETKRLFVVDNFVGVIVLDARNGQELERFSFPEDIVQPLVSDAVYGTIDTATGLFISDASCSCVHILSKGEWQTGIVTTLPEAEVPRSIIISGTPGTLHVTFIVDNQINITPSADGNTTIALPEDTFFEQPLLGVDNSQNLLLMTSQGDLYTVIDDELVFQFTVPTGTLIQDFTVDAANNVIVLTDIEGILILNGAGDLLQSVGNAALDVPRPGELFSPVALVNDNNGTLYIADSNGGYSTITAMSRLIEAGRQGKTTLEDSQSVQGTLTQTGTAQTWFYEATAAEIINVGVFASPDSFNLDPILQVLAADGTEIARMDNTQEDDELLINPVDLYLKNVTLPQPGIYRIVVSSNSGADTYRLGLSSRKTIDIDTNNTGRGKLSDTLLIDGWQFSGQAGQTVRITLEPDNFLLDPALRLYSPQGDLLDENLDAFDESLFPGSAQIDLQLPQTGDYLIEAVHNFGSGDYTLSISSE